MKKKIALIFGITGQDGSYLARYLIKNKYIVHGVKRRTSIINTSRVDDLLTTKSFEMHFGDVTDSFNILSLIKKIKPTEIYNLSAQSHVAVSFLTADYTSNVNALGCLKILEAIKNVDETIKFYQAGTSELYGKITEKPQNEETPFYPRSPYAVSKLFAHWITKNYREAFGMFACNGILFNHESPLRGETFVTRKIVRGLCKIKKGKQKKLILGNLYSKRDWGHAEDYVEAMHLILQQKKPDDFVIATGKQYTVKDFLNKVLNKLKIEFKWQGKGLNECVIDQKTGKKIVECSTKYFRPSEVDDLLGDFSKAKKKLRWKPKKNIDDLINEMIKNEINNV